MKKQLNKFLPEFNFDKSQIKDIPDLKIYAIYYW